MSRAGRRPRVNPFSTQFVQPGAVPFRFPTPDGLAALVGRFGGRGQVVGPHGSGKSTLLATLLPALSGWHVRPVLLNATHRRLPASVWDDRAPDVLLVIDGFEQLGLLTRRALRRHARRRGGGLLVTAHRPVGLPTLWRTDVTAETASEVIAGLVPPGGEWVLAGYDAAARLRRHRGSLRAVLFELYDRWERGPPPGA